MADGGLQAGVRTLGAAVRREAGAIAARMRGQDAAAWDAPSWCEGWSARDVVSHLTEGTERFYLQTRAGLDGQPVPEFSPEERNARRAKVKAMPPAEMLAELERRNQVFFDDLEARDDATLGRPAVPLGPGRTLTGAQIAALRLNELLLHHWDLRAPAEPAATLDAESAALVADYVLANAARMAQTNALQGLDATFLCEASGPGGGPVTIACRGGKCEVTRGATGQADATLRLPLETLLRLVWGRVALQQALADGTIQATGDREQVLALGRAFGNR
ncbi:MAG TPA: maleylpyruvate isomerase family mycothiol-dependent enzyme [Chloroflexota bacterium]|nr:maleylpyruvate isomerase family mycothiol-dependent enzyme [Chloroflexota bacterium]